MENKAIKNMEYWKKKNSIPGIEALADSGLTDGRAGSSPFQIATPGSSPNKNMIKKALGFMNPLSGGPLGAGIRALAPNSQMAQGMTDPFGFQGGGGAGAMFGGMAGGAAPGENPMAAVPMQTPMVMESPMKQEEMTDPDKDITGHGGSKTPDVLYKSDGTAVETSQIDEEMLDLKTSIGPKGKFVNYTDEDGTKIKYYYKNPVDPDAPGTPGTPGFEPPVTPEDMVPLGGVGN